MDLENRDVCQKRLSRRQPEALLWMGGETRSLGRTRCVASTRERTLVSVWRRAAAGAAETQLTLEFAGRLPRRDAGDTREARTRSTSRLDAGFPRSGDVNRSGL